MSTAEIHSQPEHQRRGLLLVGFGREETFAWGWFAVSTVAALIMHAALGLGASQAPPKKAEERIEMAVYIPPPPPPPPVDIPPPPEPEKPKPKEPVPVPKEVPPPPPSNDKPPAEPPSEPVPIVTGLNLNSTVKGGASFAAPVGNTTFGNPDGEKRLPADQIKPYQGASADNFKAVKLAQITREAAVVKDHKARFPAELANQGIEGQLIAILQVSKTGKVLGVRKIKGTGNPTLDALALDSLKRFVMRPAEVDGVAVDSDMRYTYTFETYD